MHLVNLKDINPNLLFLALYFFHLLSKGEQVSLWVTAAGMYTLLLNSYHDKHSEKTCTPGGTGAEMKVPSYHR
jgi:hypothetical protein